MPRKKKTAEVSEGTKAVRRRFARGDRKARASTLPVDFDWNTVNCTTDKSPASAYKFRCSTKCERENENPPLSYSGNGRMIKYRTAKGKLRWMFSFLRRSERDDMVRDCKMMNGRKAKKEPNRESEE